jgi:hypothetical protein
MYETLTVPYVPRPTERFQPIGGPTIAKWTLHRSRRQRLEERFQDLNQHPWRGERQVGQARGLYANNVRQADRDLLNVPYADRVVLPASGNYPLVQGLEVGTGPHPWLAATDAFYLDSNLSRPSGRNTGARGRPDPVRGKAAVSTTATQTNNADWEQGPNARRQRPFPAQDPYPTPSPTPPPTRGPSMAIVPESTALQRFGRGVLRHASRAASTAIETALTLGGGAVAGPTGAAVGNRLGRGGRAAYEHYIGQNI